MKSTRHLILFLVLLVVAPTAHARIGETIAQCAVRYGQPVGGINPWDAMTNAPKGTYQMGSYTKNGYSIEITFENGIAVELDIWKMGKSGEELTADEQKMFLDANSAGQVWSQPKKIQVRGDTFTQRTRPDGVIAFSDLGFRIVTKAYDDAHEKYLDSLPKKDAGPTNGF